MPIIFALMIVAIGAQIISGIYALINPFIQQMGDIQQYNVAYYGAIAGVERAELVLKRHTAGFEGSGGWLGNTDFGPNSDYSNVDKQYFGPLAFKNIGHGIFWDIKNLNTNGIVPASGKGDLDPDVSSGNNYYRLTFDKSIQIALYKDKSDTAKYYTGYSSLTDIKPTSSLEVSMRVPQKLYENYGGLGKALDKGSNFDLDGDGVNNDIVANRSLFGLTGTTEFTIFPSINLDLGTNAVSTNDTSIREDVINAYSSSSEYNIKFDTTSKDSNPCALGDHTQNVTDFNQSPENSIATGFDVALRGTNISKMHAKFSLVNLLKYSDDEVYPYLEIKVKNNTSLPDTYFHIKGEGKVGKYDVRIKMSQSVFESSAASDFTVLF